MSKKSQIATNKDVFYNQADLLKKGWTKKKIEMFLCKPDRFMRNPFYPKGALIKLYSYFRVDVAEKSEEFKNWNKTKKL